MNIVLLKSMTPHVKSDDSLCSLETFAVLFYMTSPQTSHVLERMLSLTFPTRIRRKLLNHILGSVVMLTKDPAGSHIVDACWNATHDMRHYREKMAREMAQQADVVKDDFFGKRVWRNWNMEGFMDGRFDWGRQQDGSRGGQFAKMPIAKPKAMQERKGKTITIPRTRTSEG